jgi:hypothetical protein
VIRRLIGKPGSYQRNNQGSYHASYSNCQDLTAVKTHRGQSNANDGSKGKYDIVTAVFTPNHGFPTTRSDGT